ncbi:YgjV family protein [Poseidonibacter lekithochrous]|uniref:YgjV family protein n=1 Tax=Poseidonibacter lekithochrous TaxID=1904463 RepID=UPI0008FC56C5|nr:YgjV family protein [Poseidonibacter lekithochrous]QKJ23236.1 putative bacterial inner membrane protein [Poseidonibacter lekithochrous]
MSALTLSIIGTLSVLLHGLGTAQTCPSRSKLYIGTAVVLIIPDLYYSGGLHGALQSVVIATLFFLGSLELSKIEKIVKYFLPIFTMYLFYKLQEPIGLLLVLAGITTTLATIAKKNYDVKRLLFISLFCWGTYALYYQAWFTVAFDVLGICGIIYSLRKEKKKQKNL